MDDTSKHLAQGLQERLITWSTIVAGNLIDVSYLSTHVQVRGGTS